MISYAIGHIAMGRDFMHYVFFWAAVVSVFATPLFGYLSFNYASMPVRAAVSSHRLSAFVLQF